ncbi:FbpB family small basic protein [Alkalihalobacillus sp. AL-G]|nr:FbpB family small basic protein [Alkalihalobacillus sp. AL-G]WLD92594.1 FbpB family small basic protein [Alkalihalobacillus sp. AL-G]
MRKPRRQTFKQLVIENKIDLVKSKEEMEKIDKKIEDKQLSKPV